MAEGSSSFARSGSAYLILITSYHSKACRYRQSGQIGPESWTEVHSPVRRPQTPSLTGLVACERCLGVDDKSQRSPLHIRKQRPISHSSPPQRDQVIIIYSFYRLSGYHFCRDFPPFSEVGNSRPQGTLFNYLRFYGTLF